MWPVSACQLIIAHYYPGTVPNPILVMSSHNWCYSAVQQVPWASSGRDQVMWGRIVIWRTELLE